MREGFPRDWGRRGWVGGMSVGGTSANSDSCSAGCSLGAGVGSGVEVLSSDVDGSSKAAGSSLRAIGKFNSSPSSDAGDLKYMLRSPVTLPGLGTVHAVRARFDIKAEPSGLSCAGLELRAARIMHEHRTTPYAQAREVRRSTVQRCERCLPVKSTRGRAVFQPGRVSQRLTP